MNRSLSLSLSLSLYIYIYIYIYIHILLPPKSADQSSNSLLLFTSSSIVSIEQDVWTPCTERALLQDTDVVDAVHQSTSPERHHHNAVILYSAVRMITMKSSAVDVLPTPYSTLITPLSFGCACGYTIADLQLSRISRILSSDEWLVLKTVRRRPIGERATGHCCHAHHRVANCDISCRSPW